MKLAIMQPYFFPYIGYFQLVNAVDKFIFYDDVNFIKQGWIARNRILLNGKEHLFTVGLNGSSPNKLINEIEINQRNEKVIKTIVQAYSKAPYFAEVIQLIQEVFASFNEIKIISKIAEFSIKRVSEYLNLVTIFETSSHRYGHTKHLGRAERLISICQENDADTYINPSGGKDLYDKTTFGKKGIKLYFIENHITPYKQFNHNFIPGLSILDLMMFNSVEEIRKMLDEYELR